MSCSYCSSVEVALVVAGAGRADFGGLRERADGGGGQRRQAAGPASLGGFAHRVLGAADSRPRSGPRCGHARRRGGRPRLRRGRRSTRAASSIGRLDGGGVRRAGLARVTTSVVFWSAKASQLRQLRRTAVPLRRRRAGRAAASGGGRADRPAPADGLRSSASLSAEACEVVAPDVAAVDDAGDQGLAAQRRRARAAEVDGALEEVDVQGLDAVAASGAELAVAVRRKAWRRASCGRSAAAEVAVGAGDGGLELGAGVSWSTTRAGSSSCTHWRRRRRASRAARRRPAGVLQAGQRLEAGGRAVGGLGQQQVGDRADEHGAGLRCRCARASSNSSTMRLDGQARSWCPDRSPGTR